MFTSQPSLSQRIERMIADTPVYDPHALLPAAPDLATLIRLSPVYQELLGVGMPAGHLDDAAGNGVDPVRRAIPYLRQTRNTASSWCLYRIFRDLYDFYDFQLDDANVSDLASKVASTGRDACWPRQVLDRCNFHSDPCVNEVVRLDLTTKPPLFQLDPVDLNTALVQMFGEMPSTPDRLAQLLRGWLDQKLSGPRCFATIALPIDRRIGPADELAVANVLSSSFSNLQEHDLIPLVQFLTWTTLSWHQEHRKTLELLVGLSNDPFYHSGISLDVWRLNQSMPFLSFSDARFVLDLGSDLVAPFAAALACQHPNVYLSGYGSPGLVPESIESIFGQRVHSVPMTKIVGFTCHSAHVEWAYATFQIVKKSLASTLARLVDSGYYEEDELLPILHQTLFETPRQLFCP